MPFGVSGQPWRWLSPAWADSTMAHSETALQGLASGPPPSRCSVSPWGRPVHLGWRHWARVKGQGMAGGGMCAGSRRGGAWEGLHPPQNTK